MLSWAIRCLVMMAGVAALAAYGSGVDIERLAAAWRHDQGKPPAPVERAAAPSKDVYASELRIRADRNGHYYLQATVNGTPVRFMVDTGATMVALNAEDAARIGIRTSRQDYKYRISTANGIVTVAGVTLRNVTVGNFTAREVEAAVTETLAGTSLLGMSFLRQLQSFEVRDDILVFRW